MANPIVTLVGTLSKVHPGDEQTGPHVGVTGVMRLVDGSEERADNKWVFYGKFYKGPRPAPQDMNRRVVVTAEVSGAKDTLYAQSIALDPAPGQPVGGNPAPALQPTGGGHVASLAERLGATSFPNLGATPLPTMAPAFPGSYATLPGDVVQRATETRPVDKDTSIARQAIAKSLLDQKTQDGSPWWEAEVAVREAIRLGDLISTIPLNAG